MGDSLSRGPALCVVLHDVAPPTWPDYAAFVGALDRIGPIPLTLLVVPDFHRQAPLHEHPDFCRAMNERLACGDEVALHGYHHDDPSPVGMRPRDWVMRRVYTHEGEFYRLTVAEATERIERGLDAFARQGWPVDGFVPPAWLLGEHARTALQQFEFAYTSNLHGLIRLPTFQPMPAPAVVWSARSAWRRQASKVWNVWRLRQWQTAPLLRLGLHPVDMRHASARRFWLETLSHLLASRTAVTKSAWLSG